MKNILAALTLAFPVFAHAEVIQYKHNPSPTGGFTVLTSRACPDKGHSRIAFRTDDKNVVTRVGCWTTVNGLYAILWTQGKGGKALYADTILRPSSLSLADLNDE